VETSSQSLGRLPEVDVQAASAHNRFYIMVLVFAAQSELSRLAQDLFVVLNWP
jgi:hypothetical protein